MRRAAMAVWTLVLTTACAQATTREPTGSESAAVALAPLRLGKRPIQSHFPAALAAQLTAAAHRLVDLQADRIGDNAGNGLNDSDPDDGGWDWMFPADTASHSDAASADNTYGVTALGVWAAVRAGADVTRFRTGLLDVALGAQENSEIDSASDIVFLTLLSDMTHDPGYSELARQRYDARRALLGSAEAIAIDNRDRRHAADHDGLIPIDLAWRNLAAVALDAAFPGAGYDADASVYSNVAVADMAAATPLFDSANGSENFYTHGLGYAPIVLARAGTEPALLASVRQRLLDAQNADGSWSWNGTFSVGNVQATAYVVHGFALSGSRDLATRRAIARAVGWLSDQQAANGGWQYATDVENSEVNAEVALALYLAHLAGASDALEPRTQTVTALSAALTAHVAGSADQPPLATPAP